MNDSSMQSETKGEEQKDNENNKKYFF